MLSFVNAMFFQIGDVDNEAEKISPDEHTGKPDEKSTKKKDNRDNKVTDEKEVESTTNVSQTTVIRMIIYDLPS